MRWNGTTWECVGVWFLIYGIKCRIISTTYWFLFILAIIICWRFILFVWNELLHIFILKFKLLRMQSDVLPYVNKIDFVLTFYYKAAWHVNCVRFKSNASSRKRRSEITRKCTNNYNCAIICAPDNSEHGTECRSIWWHTETSKHLAKNAIYVQVQSEILEYCIRTSHKCNSNNREFFNAHIARKWRKFWPIQRATLWT